MEELEAEVMMIRRQVVKLRLMLAKTNPQCSYIGGHEWIESEQGWERCSRCRFERPRVQEPTVERQ